MTSTYEDPSSRHRSPLADPLLAPPETMEDTSGNPSSSFSVRRRHYLDSNNDHPNANATANVINNGRILDRDADFFQSRGRWNGVELLPRTTGRRNRSALTPRGQYHPSQYDQYHQQSCCTLQACQRRLRRYWPRLWDDWFHTLAYQRTVILMLVLFVVYSGIVVAFGFLYFAVSILGATKTQQADGSFVTSSFCDMDINDHMEALYFSLSTMTTIGYGVSDYYFGGCWTPLLLVLMQVCTAITFDACAVGLLFTRLSRGRKRSKSVIVSNQAVVQVVQGVPYFMLRVGELRRFPLINASVRLYCIRHERIPKLVNPLSTAIVTSTTTTSSLSGYQDLATAARESAAAAAAAGAGGDAASATTAKIGNHQNVNNALSSSLLANTPSRIPIETTHFVTRAMKLLHPVDESLMHSNYILMSLPQVIVHRMDESSPLMPPALWYDARGQRYSFPPRQNNDKNDNLLDVQAQIQHFWMDRGVEIVVLVEGTDELTGAAIQTRHSYCTSSPPPPPQQQHVIGEEEHDNGEGDVTWNRSFVNCILPYGGDDLEQGERQPRRSYRQHPVCTVDFSRFHATVPSPRDCGASPYVPC